MTKRSTKICAAVSPAISSSLVKTNVTPHTATTRKAIKLYNSLFNLVSF